MVSLMLVFVHVGESGLGKSTMVNTLFRSKISRTACVVGPHPIPSTTEVNSVCHGACADTQHPSRNSHMHTDIHTQMDTLELTKTFMRASHTHAHK